MSVPRRALLALALATCLAPGPAIAQEAAARPTIGLVLSGGGARGLAHVGVLEVLEELRVPIDAIAGTSMGAIVGGLWASGLSAAEIRAILEGVEWERILADAPPRTSLDAFRRAGNRRYGVELDVGLTPEGPVLPSGLIAGQDLGLLLRRHTLPVASVSDFTRLPTPFAAVATDLATGDTVVLRDGDLVRAMRASMAIPVVFSPVERDGRLLVDGGLVANLPVGLARELGADVVIAVDVSPPLEDREDLRDLLGISRQLVALMSRQDVDRQLALADVALDLEMEDVGIFDFRDADSIVARGAREARAAATELGRWSLPPDEWTAWREARAGRRPDPPARPAEIRLDGPAWLDERLVLARVDPALRDTLDPDLAEAAARRIYGLGEFERVGYDLAGDATRPTLVFRPVPKGRGPHAVRFDVDLATDSAREGPARLWFQAIVGYTRERIGARAATWRLDLLGGTASGAETAFRQPLDFAGHWFVEPSARALAIQRPVFVGEGAVTEYETGLVEVGVDVGRAIGPSAVAQVGLAVGRATSELDPVAAALAARFPDEADDVGEFRAAVVVDRLDAVNLPRHGVYARSELRASSEGLGADEGWTRAEVEGRGYASRGPHTWLAGIAAGGATPAARLPARAEFLLGGFGSLSGFSDAELRGEAYAVVRAGWLRRVAELPPALRAVVVGGWLEAGDVWDPSVDEEVDLRPAVTAVVGAETLLGPVFLGVSRAEGGRGRIVVALGRAP